LRVFLDTNVLVSAIATRGLSADVFRLVLDKHELLTAEPVLAEVERILGSKFGLSPRLIGQTLRFLRRFPVEPTPDVPAATPITDPDDRLILEAAIRAGAEVLITGDAAFLAVADQVDTPRIVNPRGFWEMHREARG